VYYRDDPQIEWFGNAKYGTCWTQDDVDPSNWSEPLMEVDKLAQYDYPEGTFGTFSVDMTSISDIPSGAYICEVVIIINQERYEVLLPFAFDGQTGGITGGTTNEPQTSFNLDASIVHYPNISAGDLVIGGIWKLQGIHEAATSFSQEVRVYYRDDPQIEWFGNAKYGTCWTQDDVDPSNWSEPLMEVDKLAQYDYPEGTFGTFSVDMTSISDIPSGAYICEVVIIINQERYERPLSFTL
jgi:hypothetical protein